KVWPRPELGAHKRPPCDSMMDQLIGSPIRCPEAWWRESIEDLLRLLRLQSHASIADRDQELTTVVLLRLDRGSDAAHEIPSLDQPRLAAGCYRLRRPSEDTYTSTLQLAQLSDHLAGLVGMSGESGSGPAWS